MNFKPSAELPRWLLDSIATVPSAGEGVHAWLFSVARQLHAHLPAIEIVRLLESQVVNCGRHVPRSEIVSAVQNSIGCAWRPDGKSVGVQSGPKWPKINQERRAAIILDGGGLADLRELSPVRLEDEETQTDAIIDRLFPGNPLLCCGKSNCVFDTKPREDWREEMSTLALIVPSPMSAIEGLTKQGKPSRHSLSNTGPRRFLICEFDTGTADEHAALLIHLAGYAPLVCAVHSGGKSLHGWFFVAGQPEEKVRKFFRYAVSVGADDATWTRSQFVRMPDGTRDTGTRQIIFFFNPKSMETTR